MKARIFIIRKQPVDVDAILFFIRIVCGCAFIFHGWGKIQNPLHWMGEESSFPTVFQLLAAISEFGGGIVLIVGFLTRLGALGIGCTMLVAVCKHFFVRGDPFVSLSGGPSYELALVYFSIALLLMILGPGRFSLDGKIFGTA